MKETRYHLIKESDIDSAISEAAKPALSKMFGFNGSTHRDLRDHIPNTANYIKTKDAVEYWIFPYYYAEGLGAPTTNEAEEVVSQSLTLEEFNNFGFDEPEPIEI